MDSSDPKAVKALLSGRVPEDLVDQVLQHLEQVDTFSEPPPDLTATHTMGLDSVARGLFLKTHSDGPYGERSHVAQMPTLARDANPSDFEVKPIARTPDESSRTMLAPGTKISHFEVVRLLGRGGMGEVYLARDTQLGRKVALKLIKPGLVRDQKSLLRFLQEARVTARFNHPHIVTIYAVDEHDGIPFVALEYLEGMDLADRLHDGTLSLRESLRICMAVADAMTEAHQHGILHRDLKPANILIPRDGRVRVVDFGLAQELRHTTPEGKHSTIDAPSGPIMGTPAYMAPEQWQSDECTGATDIWAFGVIMHEMVCGKRPYSVANLVQLGMKVTSPDPVILGEEIAGIPPQVARLIESCLSKDPSQRPKADALRDALSEILSESKQTAIGEESPFRGLLPFSERHSNLFFGRESELNTCMERLRHEPSLVVVGPSGAGKTSFVQAGIIPRLKEDSNWTVVRIRPGENPIDRLAYRLMVAQHDQSQSSSIRTSVEEHSGFSSLDATDVDILDREISTLSATLRENPKKLNLLLRRLAADRQSRILLLIDQLEELFTLCRDSDEQTAFIEAVTSAADEAMEPIRVLCTVRDDFLGHLARGGETARALLEHVMILEPPGQVALKEVLTLPLLRVGYSFDDPSLADEMVAAVEEAASLPLLQFAARTLWDRRDRVNFRLRRADYEAMGGVEGALARHADEVLHGLSHHELQIARTLLLRLVTPESTRRVQSERQLLDGMDQEARTVFERLTKSRLLAVRRSKSSSDDGTRLELAHESLIHNWDRLARWIEESREELIILNEVSQAAELWERRGRQEEELWSGSGLAEAQRILGRGDTELSSLVESFLEQGRIRDDKKRSRRRFWSFAIPLFLMTVAAVLFLQKMDAEDSREQSERGRLQALHQRKTAESQRKTAQEKQVEALLESAQTAYTEGDTLEVRAKFRNALEMATSDASDFLGIWWQLSRLPERWKMPIGSHFYHVQFSPDGRYAASAAMNGSVEIFDPITGDRRVLRGHNDQIIRLTFSPDSRYLASGGYAENIRVWETQTGAEVFVLPRPLGPVRAMAFSRDGKQLAVATQERRVRLWTLNAEPSPEDFAGNQNERIYDLNFDDNGRLVVARGVDSKLILTGPRPNSRVRVLASDVQTEGRDRAQFSQDGRRIVWVADRKTARIWDVKSSKLLNRFTHGALPLHHLFALNGSGTHLAMPTRDGAIEIMNVDTGSAVGMIAPAHAEFAALALSPRGDELLETGPNYIRLSDAPDIATTKRPMGQLSPVYAVAIGPNGKQVASASSDSTFSLWDGDAGARIPLYPGMSGGKRDSVAYSDDGRFLAWADQDGRVRIWNRKKNVLHAKLTAGPLTRDGLPPRLRPQGLRFSAGGKRLVYLDAGWMAVWAVESRRKLSLQRWPQGIDGALAISADGQRGLISVGPPGRGNGHVELWDLVPPRKLRDLEGHKELVPGVAFDPKGKFLVTADWGGTAYRWSATGGEPSIIFRGPVRVNHVATHPDGDRVAFAMTDGSARIVWLRSGKRVDLQGHVNEVNHVDFSANGKFLVSGGDDGTVRLWDAETGEAQWETRALLANPPRLLTHSGWTHLSKKQAANAVPSGARWTRRLADDNRLSSNSDLSPWICMVSDQDEVELWDASTDLRKWSTEVQGVQEILATPNGCILRTNTELIGYDEAGTARHYALGADRDKEGSEPVTAMSVVGSEVLAASGDQISRHRLNGERTATYKLTKGISALSLIPAKPNQAGTLVIGFDDGSVETLDLGSLDYGYNTQVVIQRSAKVTRIIPVQGGLIAIGMANGWAGLWDSSSRRLLDHVELHGSIAHLLAEDGQVHVASDLGDAYSWNVEVFGRDLCQLTRDMWSAVPVKWLYGRAVFMDPPQQHPCHSTD